MVCRDQVLFVDFTKKGVNGAYTLVVEGLHSEFPNLTKPFMINATENNPEQRCRQVTKTL